MYFVSEDTALSRSIVQKHPVHFLPHFAIGQIRRDGVLRAIWSGLKNFWRSALLALKLRPDVVISTGAGSVFFFMIWCRLFGAKFILIETFARFDKPSTFARAAALFANDIIVQSSALTKTFPTAAVFDPLKILDQPRPNKKRLLFATVGVTFPFDRLVEMVAKLKEDGEIFEDVVFQTGIGGLTATRTSVVRDSALRPGQILSSGSRHRRLPRRHGIGHYRLARRLPHHCRRPEGWKKASITTIISGRSRNAFAARGLITPANSAEELALALKTARSLKPVCATTDPVALVKASEVSCLARRPSTVGCTRAISVAAPRPFVQKSRRAPENARHPKLGRARRPVRLINDIRNRGPSVPRIQGKSTPNGHR